MSQKRKTTLARVYVEGAPVVHIAGREISCSRDTDRDGDCHLCVSKGGCIYPIPQPLDLLQGEIKGTLMDPNGVLENYDTDGNLVQIPTKRVIDVVYPVIDEEQMQGPESGMDPYQREAEAWLAMDGGVSALLDGMVEERGWLTVDGAFVAAYIAGRAFHGDSVVTLRTGFTGVVTACDEEGRFTIAGMHRDGEPDTLQNVSVGGIQDVLCWSGAEDWLRTGDSSQADITAKGFVAGLGKIQDAYEASEREVGPKVYEGGGTDAAQRMEREAVRRAMPRGRPVVDSPQA